MSTILPWENEEVQNYICMEKIVNDIVCKGLRSVFKQEWNSHYHSSFGAWDDTSASGLRLFHLEKTRSRPNKNVYQAAFQHGDTNCWDCSVLFDAILYSNSIDKAGLSPKIKSEVNNLREIRNDIKHNTEGKLTNSQFQNVTTRVENALSSLGLPVDEVNQIKAARNRYKSFQDLPSKPAHEVVYRFERIQQIRQELQQLRSDRDGKLTYFYISGNPGSGKSQLARQVCEETFNDVSSLMEPKFVMTLNGTDLKSLLYSYENFCRRLNCNESAIENITNSSKPNEVKTKDLRSLLSSRIKSWKRWWIIVDNVENITEISRLLPQIGDDTWINGQVIVTTQNKTSVPLDNLFTKHVSLCVDDNDELPIFCESETQSGQISCTKEVTFSPDSQWDPLPVEVDVEEGLSDTLMGQRIENGLRGQAIGENKSDFKDQHANLYANTDMENNPVLTKSIKHRKILDELEQKNILEFGPPLRYFSPERKYSLGKGCNGTSVYVGILQDGSEVAVKVMLTNACEKEADNENNILNLIDTKKSPFIVSYREYLKDRTFIYLILDLCEEPLDKHVGSQTIENLRTHGRRMIREILSGLQFLHDHGILHRDLKPKNVLVDIDGHMKLADFGISRVLSENETTVCTDAAGTKDWMAAEVISNIDEKVKGRFKKKSDIQSAGMIAFFILTKGEHPFGATTYDRMKNIVDGKPVNLNKLDDTDSHQFVSRLIAKEIKDRPYAHEALVWPFMVIV